MTKKEAEIANPQAHPEMLSWQYREIIAELAATTAHAQSEDCPCNQTELELKGERLPEFCLAKHLLNINFLGRETALMDAPNRDLFEDLADEAIEYHKKAKEIYCKGGTWPDLAEWCRAYRKKIELLYYVCHIGKVKKAAAKLHEDIDFASLFDSTKIDFTRIFQAGALTTDNGIVKESKGGEKKMKDITKLTGAGNMKVGDSNVEIVEKIHASIAASLTSIMVEESAWREGDLYLAHYTSPKRAMSSTALQYPETHNYVAILKGQVVDKRTVETNVTITSPTPDPTAKYGMPKYPKIIKPPMTIADYMADLKAARKI